MVCVFTDFIMSVIPSYYEHNLSSYLPREWCLSDTTKSRHVGGEFTDSVETSEQSLIYYDDLRYCETGWIV